MSSEQRNVLLDAALRYIPSGQLVVVTGGTKGIGRAAVLELATLGAQVFTCARRADDLEELLGHCSSLNLNNVNGVVADVSTKEGRITLIEAVHAAWGGKIDALINVSKLLYISCINIRFLPL
jgi:tropinone reductase I